MSFFTNSLTRLTISATGALTVATPTSGTALTVNGVSGGTIVSLSDGTVTSLITMAGPSLQIGTTTSHDVSLYTNNSTKWIIKATSGQLQSVSGGSVGTPSFSFSTDSDTGIFTNSADILAITAGGVLVAQFRNVAGAVKFLGADGSVGQPYYTFDLDTDTGIYRIGADNCALVAGGAAVLTWNATTVSTPNATNIGVLNSTSIAINAQSTATATAGGATLPANPQGFITISINGTSRKIPYYQT
jgi:hypothetical protein